MRDKEKRVHLRISGKVQGVGFRYFCQTKAHEWGIRGWVRNRTGGDVELEAQSEVGTIQRFINEVKGGPPGALVNDVQINEIPAQNTDEEFEVRF